VKAACVIVGFCLAGAVAAQPAQPVRAPHYGDVLFQHFQSRWFGALGSLMTSQQFQRLGEHEAEAELLRGGLLLDWGQHDEAAQVFEHLAAHHPTHRDRAWLGLARARWQRGLVDEAEAALAQVQAPLAGERDDERLLLQAQLHLARGRAAQAAAVLQPVVDVKTPRGATPLARHNQGLALLRAGDLAAARPVLLKLGSEATASEEQRTLRDRANLALALAERDRQPAAARAALQRVRLHGSVAGKALLADGWAAMDLNQPQAALVAWTELAGRSAADPAVLEARLALPQAYVALGARGQALLQVERLLQSLDDDARALAAARSALHDGSALAPLLQALQGYEPGQDAHIDLPGGEHAAALAPVWADHGFQQALTRWADLQWSAAELQRWAAALPAFDDMLALRRSGFEQRLPPTLRAAQDDTQGLAAQQRARDALAQQLQQAEAADDGAALATAAQLAQLQRLARMQQDLAALDAGDERDALADRVRRLHGLLAWQLADQRAQRLRDASKALRTLDQALQQAQGALAALQQAQADEPPRLDALAERIAALASRLLTTLPQVLALADEQRVGLQGLAVALLDQHQQHLAATLLQARLLHAQLQDGSVSAQAGQGDPHAQP
jgi:hypothetical protein